MCVCPRSPSGAAPRPSPSAPRPVCCGVLVRCFTLALLCVALVHADRPKRADSEFSKESAVPFTFGRYGRSAERIITPRNDRFFMGSRYGKRSAGDEWSEETRGVWRGSVGGDCRLLCKFTGAPQLYRCVAPHDRYSYERRSGTGMVSKARGDE